MSSSDRSRPRWLGLEADDADLAALRERSTHREGSPSATGNTLNDAPQLHLGPPTDGDHLCTRDTQSGQRFLFARGSVNPLPGWRKTNMR